MLRFIWRHLRSRSRDQPPGQVKLEKRIEELQSDVNKIASNLAAITKELAQQSYDLKIEKVCVDKVDLDQIVFNIDGMAVKDLSGSLSIGLNYGGKVIRLEAPKKPTLTDPEKDQTQKSPPPSGEQAQVKVNFNNGSKEGKNTGKKS